MAQVIALRVRLDAQQGVSAARSLEAGFNRAGGGARRFGKDVGGLQQALDLSLKSTLRLAGPLAALFSAQAIGRGVRNAVASFSEFETKMAEISTLLSDTSDMDALTQAVRRASEEFASAPVEQAQALYQIISAGASSAAEATQVLTAANKLALGGVTEVATAADGLTSILNAYGPAVGSATDVSDALFVAMRAGKTTIGELSASIGQVAPIAAQVGVSLEEVLAATSALTKGGQNTSVAMRGLRQIVASVVKPSSEASEMAEALGVSFDAASLESHGLAGFLQMVTQATGGSTEKMAQLFGGVEALVPVLALTGTSAGDFAEILESMGEKSGETDTAVGKMTENVGFLFGQMQARVTNLAQEFVSSAAPSIVTALKGIIEWFDKNRVAIQAWGKAVIVAAIEGGKAIINFGGIAADSATFFAKFAESSVRFFAGDFKGAMAAGRDAVEQFGQSGRKLENITEALKGLRDAFAGVDERAAELRSQGKELNDELKTFQDVLDALEDLLGDVTGSLEKQNDALGWNEENIKAAAKAWEEYIKQAREAEAAAVAFSTTGFRAFETPLHVIDETLSGVNRGLQIGGPEASLIPERGFGAEIARGIARGADEIVDAADEAQDRLSDTTFNKGVEGFVDAISGAFSLDNIGTGIGQFLGQGLAGVASNLLGQGLSALSGLFGGGDSAEEERRRVLRENTEALKRATESIDQLAGDLLSLSADAVDSFREVLEFIRTGRARGGFIEAGQIAQAGQFFDIDIPEDASRRDLQGIGLAQALDELFDARDRADRFDRGGAYRRGFRTVL